MIEIGDCDAVGPWGWSRFGTLVRWYMIEIGESDAVWPGWLKFGTVMLSEPGDRDWGLWCGLTMQDDRDWRLLRCPGRFCWITRSRIVTTSGLLWQSPLSTQCCLMARLPGKSHAVLNWVYIYTWHTPDETTETVKLWLHTDLGCNHQLANCVPQLRGPVRSYTPSAMVHELPGFTTTLGHLCLALASFGQPHMCSVRLRSRTGELRVNSKRFTIIRVSMIWISRKYVAWLEMSIRYGYIVIFLKIYLM